MASVSYRPNGTLDLRRALRPYEGAWTERLAAHLLRRAGFGGTRADIARLAALRPDDAVASLVTFPPAPQLAAEPSLGPGFSFRGGSYLRDLVNQLPPETAKEIKLPPPGKGKLGEQFVIALIGSALHNAVIAQQWWLRRMIATPAPLQEKMTLFWHGHFTSALDIEKGITFHELIAQNQLFRRYALGNVRELTHEVSRDPAMLKYLDNAKNVKSHPNENYARELMELYTLGIGHYTEQDVRESARAFTGWSVRPSFLVAGGFQANPAQHDDGTKTVLGQTGRFDGNDVVEIIFKAPAAPKHFARALLSFFVYNDPEPELVDLVGGLLAEHRFELRPVMQMLLRSEIFYSDRAYRALVKSPVEYVVGLHQLLELPDVDVAGLDALRRMEQVLFYPPNVKGWEGGAAWLNTHTLLTRANYASALVTSSRANPAWLREAMRENHPSRAAHTIAARALMGDVSPATTAKIAAYLEGAQISANGTLSGENAEERFRGGTYLAVISPAYQLN